MGERCGPRRCEAGSKATQRANVFQLQDLIGQLITTDHTAAQCATCGYPPCASRGSGLVFGFRARGTATKVCRATWRVYDDAHHQVGTAQGYATGAQWDTFTLINPVSITNFDEAGNLLEEIQAVRGSTSGKTN